MRMRQIKFIKNFFFLHVICLGIRDLIKVFLYLIINECVINVKKNFLV